MGREPPGGWTEQWRRTLRQRGSGHVNRQAAGANFCQPTPQKRAKTGAPVVLSERCSNSTRKGMKTKQPEGARGSLKWIQRAVNQRWPSLEQPILQATSATSLRWTSPLSTDDYAEYRDGGFLDAIDQSALREALTAFWPARGPQWDALGVTSGGDVLLVEAKAHIAEMCSPGTAASAVSRARIEAALDDVAGRLGAKANRASWCDHFYQLGNRIAHLDFLRRNGVPAWLVLVNFVGDREMGGPESEEAWESAYKVAFHVMGLGSRHALSPYLLHVYPRTIT